MDYPERFSALPEYAFPRLRTLIDHLPPGGPALSMTIGEPRHAAPAWISEVLAQNVAGFGVYPPSDGEPALLSSISGWIGRRYGVDVGPERISVLNGSREGLFNTLISQCPERKNGQVPVVLIPNPFYQVYAVAALSISAEPVYVNATAETGFLPDYESLPPELLDRVAVAYLCSPANPQGAVATEDYLARLLDLAERHDFTIFCDECYSEIWRDAPPPGLLAVAAARGADPDRVVVFNSLSKRSNVPGMRSGFVAAGPNAIRPLRQLRAYTSAPIPLPLQRVSARLWDDETHVVANRALYHEKFRIADQVLAGIPGAGVPEGGFFLWLPVEDGEQAALRLWQETGVRVLPGAYLSRDTAAGNPGKGYIRVALVAPAEETGRGLELIRDCIYR